MPRGHHFQQTKRFGIERSHLCPTISFVSALDMSIFSHIAMGRSQNHAVLLWRNLAGITGSATWAWQGKKTRFLHASNSVCSVPTTPLPPNEAAPGQPPVWFELFYANDIASANHLAKPFSANGGVPFQQPFPFELLYANDIASANPLAKPFSANGGVPSQPFSFELFYAGDTGMNRNRSHQTGAP